MKMQKTVCALFVSFALAACGGGGSKNQAPVFGQTNYAFSVNEDSVVEGQIIATDPDNDSLSFAVTVSTNHGVFKLNPATASFSYTPNANYFGSDSATIQVSDGTHFTTTTLNFTVMPVNDAPTYLSHSLQSGEAGTILGQITATDIDNDTLVFSLLGQPELGFVVLNNDGSFVYTPNELALIDDSFQVRISDGTAHTEVSIKLTSQFTTNLDKLSYYYASPSSHLKVAEGIAQTLNDSATTDTIYRNLASGYYQADFAERALSLINDKVADLTVQAYSFMELADLEASSAQKVSPAGEATPLMSLSSQSERYGKAVEFYTRAFALYNQAMSEKGYGNVSSNDSSFYQSLSNKLIALGEQELSRKVSSQLILIADNIRTDVYSTAYGRILTAFGSYAATQVDTWLKQKTVANKNTALDTLAKFAYITENTGYQLVSGYSVTNIQTLNLISVASLYFQLGELTRAKEYTAKAFATYNYFSGETPTYRSLDPAYDQPQGKYAATTLQRYPAGLGSLMPMIAANFPEKYDMVFELLNKYGTATQIANAKTNSQIYFAYQRIKNGEAVTPVLESLKTTFNNTETYFQALLSYTGDNLAVMLKNQGFAAQANEVAAAAYTVFASSDYQTTILTNYKTLTPALYTLGNRGCLGVKDIFESLDLTPEGLLEVCENHLALFEPSKQLVTTTQTADAYRTVARMYQSFGKPFDATTLATTLQAQSALVADRKTRIYQTAYSAAAVASVGQLNIALEMVETALADTYTYVHTREYTKPADLTAIVSYIPGYLVHEFSNSHNASSLEFPITQASFRAQAHIGENAKLLQRFNALVATKLSVLETEFKTLTDNEQQAIAAKRLAANLGAGLEAQANAQLTHPSTSPANKLVLTGQIATHHALLDHFPQSTIASVDTDQDGKPNFFTPNATEEDIMLSGLVADDDSDNDGVLDPDDKAPLDPTKH